MVGKTCGVAGVRIASLPWQRWESGHLTGPMTRDELRCRLVHAIILSHCRLVPHAGRCSYTHHTLPDFIMTRSLHVSSTIGWAACSCQTLCWENWWWFSHSVPHWYHFVPRCHWHPSHWTCARESSVLVRSLSTTWMNSKLDYHYFLPPPRMMMNDDDDNAAAAAAVLAPSPPQWSNGQPNCNNASSSRLHNCEECEYTSFLRLQIMHDFDIVEDFEVVCGATNLTGRWRYYYYYAGIGFWLVCAHHTPANHHRCRRCCYISGGGCHGGES